MRRKWRQAATLQIVSRGRSSGLARSKRAPFWSDQRGRRRDLEDRAPPRRIDSVSESIGLVTAVYSWRFDANGILLLASRHSFAEILAGSMA